MSVAQCHWAHTTPDRREHLFHQLYRLARSLGEEVACKSVEHVDPKLVNWPTYNPHLVNRL